MFSLGTLRRDWMLDALTVDPKAFSGLRVAVFGGTGGLGQAVARSLLAKGSQVTIVGRSLKDPPHPLMSFVQADLSSLVSARTVAIDPALKY